MSITTPTCLSPPAEPPPSTRSTAKAVRSCGGWAARLGGKKSSFEMDPRTLTIFDNGSVKKDDRSYGIVLELDEEEMSATLVRRYPHPEGRLVGTQGSVQVLPNGNVFIGWGSNPLFSEFSRDGELLFDAAFPPLVESYRAFRFPWSGHPSDD